MKLEATFDLQPFRSRMRGCHRLVTRRIRHVMSRHGRSIINSVRRRKTFFDRPTGDLQKSVWNKQEVRGDEVVQAMGWGVAHGPVLEWGPYRARRWTIPGPVAWRVGGKRVWANEVEREWSRDQLRPHFEPAFKRVEPKYMRDAQAVLVRAIEADRG